MIIINIIAISNCNHGGRVEHHKMHRSRCPQLGCCPQRFSSRSRPCCPSAPPLQYGASVAAATMLDTFAIGSEHRFFLLGFSAFSSEYGFWFLRWGKWFVDGRRRTAWRQIAWLGPLSSEVSPAAQLTQVLEQLCLSIWNVDNFA